jgi:5-carboxymethyl-2-hydroxymuconate isomerase
VRLASFIAPDGRAGFGAVIDGGIVDLRSRLNDGISDLQTLIARDALEDAVRAVAGAAADYGAGEVTYRPPVTSPEKILCIGVNYRNRNEEYRDGSAPQTYPSVFMRTPGSLTGHLQPLLRPPESTQLDYEGEIAMVIGRRGRRIPIERAREHVFGLTCMNEGTIRDWVRHAKFNVTQGKNFAHSGAIGPWIVTTGEVGDFANLHVTTRVNGEIRQHDTTANLEFSFAALIAYLSTFTELLPGDVIATGTPTGAGARFDPPRYLVAGDRVEVEVDAVGTLSNPVVDE